MDNALKPSQNNNNPPLSPWWGLYVIFILGLPLFFFLQPPPPELPKWGQTPIFTLTDQLDQTVTSRSLLGKPSVVNFIFTRCQNICPALSSSMATLQDDIAKRDANIISFTVDPEFDTPSVLKDYADRFGAKHDHWKFLTGTAEGVKVISTGYQQAYSQNPDQNGVPDITHSQKMILVDSTGEIRGFYDDNSKGHEALLNSLDRL